MKVKNIAFSGFMASILMAGAAYAVDVPTLATDQYVIQGVNYAISQAAADATSKVNTAVTNITNGTTIAAKATGDADGNAISTTYLKSADAATTYETKGTAAGLVGTLPDNKATVVAYIEDESAAAETAIEALDGDLKALQAAVAGIDEYNDTELVGRVTDLETTVGDENSGLVADVAANTQSISNLGTNKANAADVYTKTEVNGLLDDKQDTIDSDHKLSASLVDGLGTMAAENASDYTKTVNLGDLATKDTVTSADITGTIATSKIATTTDAQFISATDKAQIGTNTTAISNIVNGTTKVAKATSADSATNATKATQDASGNVITDTYATKTELGALTCDDGKYCLIVGNTAMPYDLAIENSNWGSAK